jgi:catechol 2,3-dioxygenase-like lactoylglutathione lyase family enzyme
MKTMNPDPNVKQAVPFFLVSNLEESIRYYIGGLGFESVTDVPEETVLSEEEV